LVRNQFFVS